jgi:putative transposase
MPVSKNKPTTSDPLASTPETRSPLLPEPEDFRHHLRRLAVSAVQVLLEQIMLEELEQCLGASWGECTPQRRGTRLGSSTRDLITSTGRIEERIGPQRSGREFPHRGLRALQKLRTGGVRSLNADVWKFDEHTESGKSR